MIGCFIDVFCGRIVKFPVHIAKYVWSFQHIFDILGTGQCGACSVETGAHL